MISVEKPGSPSEVLEQSGVKGMKWGFRQSRQASKTFAKAYPTPKARAVEIRRARRDQMTRKEKIGLEPKGSADRAKAKKVYLNNPDRVTALRLTRGEKIVAGILMTVGGPLALPTTAGVATVYGIRRRREKKMAEAG
jgi:hypothetical protein